MRTVARLTAVVALTAGVAAFDAATGTTIDASFFYFLPIVLACTWFDVWGVLWIPVTVVLVNRIEVWEVPGYLPYRMLADVVRMLGFALIAALTLLARSRYEQVLAARRAQEELRSDAEAHGQQLEALYRVATAANASRAGEEFLALFLDEVVRLLPHARAATVLERDGDDLVRRAVYGAIPEAVVGERIGLGEGVAGQVAAAGEPVVLYEPGLEGAAHLEAGGAHPAAVAGVPLVLHGDTVGVLLLFADAGARFSSRDMRTIQSMASEAALVLESLNLYESLRESNRALSERQQRLDEQLRLAREVQQAILSVSPTHLREGPLELASFHSSAWEVGGDFLRIMPHDGGVAFFIGDVMGKGVPAALLMTMMTAALGGSNANPEDAMGVLSEANRVLVASLAAPEWSGFVTAFYAFVDRPGLRLRYAGAGHPPPLLAHEGGEVEQLLAQGIPLGISAESEYVASDISLRPGDRLVLYTDGVTEARNANGEQLGYERLQALVAEHRACSSEHLRDAVVAAVRAFGAGSEAHLDDMAIVVLAIHPAPEEIWPD